MQQVPLVFYASLLAQACGALVLALLLLGFHRTYQRDYLRQWAWSWLARCVHLAGSGASLSLLGLPPQAPWRLGLSAVTLVAGYWEVAWLLFGTYEVTYGRSLRREVRRGVLLGLLGLSLVSVVATLPLTPALRFFGRLGLRSILAALAFLLAGAAVLHRGGPASAGRRLVGICFLLYGLRLLEYVATTVFTALGIDLEYNAFLGPIDLLLQSLIGLGLVIWLLEEERRRQQQATERLEHLAYHDPLTDLPNRNRFLETLRRAMDEAPAGRGLAVAYLDLDRFKLVNESFGHAAGDQLLVNAAHRLRRSLHSTHTVARLIGDELAVLLPGCETTTELERAVGRLLATLRPPFTVAGQQLHLTASVGVVRFPEDGTDPELLLRRGEVAMYRAKANGRNLSVLYTPGMDRGAGEQLALEAELRRALAADELELFFQPILDAAGQRIEAVEALVRWRHPERGLLEPADFLWLAEAAGISEEIDRWVLGSACEVLARWSEAGVRTRVAVNFSARTFRAADLVAGVREALAASGVPAAALEIEITETLAMEAADATAEVMRDLKRLGVGITIDDFGTGYSSLAYLRSFPIDALKVDRSFVRTLDGEPESAQIVAAVVALAHGLGLLVVAEGVEQEAQWRRLREMGCDRVQGHLFTVPVPAARCWELLRAAAEALPLPRDGRRSWE